ncbi:MAG: phosphatidylserine decarboxylase family protein [Elusimicrobiales bacterium]|nr:phosphatidylserine decarboxylase family protein [Elusimicrobiales bacterium]
MHLAPIGFKVVIYGIVAMLVGGILLKWLYWLGLPLIVLGFIFSAFSLYFFRDPERPRVFAAQEIACPADGTVMSVTNEGTPGITVVRIFLSIFNVHVQRAPVSGKVTATKYTKGKFAVAYKPEAARENEKNLIEITATDGRKVSIEQITGAIARRIQCYVNPEQQIKAGERVGIIYFGSQVAVYLPEEARILVKPGDKVAGAETVLATW